MFPRVEQALAARDQALSVLARSRAAHRAGARLEGVLSPLHALPAFPRIAIGITKAPDGVSFRLAVRVQDKAMSLDAISRLITEMTGHEPDVQFVGAVRALATFQQSRQRPLEPGLSVSHMLGGTGTLGCVVEEIATGAELLLSNAHVLANNGQGQDGDDIYQPGTGDNGTVIDFAATLRRFEPLAFDGDNLIDAALAECAGATCSTQPAGSGVAFSGRARASALTSGTPVRKVGRSTGLTHSTVEAIAVRDILVNFGARSAMFHEQIEVKALAGSAFAEEGDSGSLLIDDAGDAVALLFAVTDDGKAYGNPIATVLSTLGVRLK